MGELKTWNKVFKERKEAAVFFFWIAKCFFFHFYSHRELNP